MSCFDEHDTIKLVWKCRINIIFRKDQTNLQKQIQLKVKNLILTFVKNCQGQILIDQNRSEILEESMRCSILVKFEGFSLQLYYQPNSFTGIVVFCVLLRNTYSEKHFLLAVPLYVNCETSKLSWKPLKKQIKKKISSQFCFK